MRGGHPGEVRRAAGARDDHADPSVGGGLRVLGHQIRRPVRGHDPGLEAHAELLERVAAVLHRLPVRPGAHDHADLRLGHQSELIQAQDPRCPSYPTCVAGSTACTERSSPSGGHPCLQRRTPLRTAMVTRHVRAPPRRARRKERTSRGRARGEQEHEGEGELELRDLAERGDYRIPIMVVREKIGESGEAERFGGPAAEAYENRAIPRATIAFKQVARSPPPSRSRRPGSARARPRRRVAGARADHADRSRDRDVHDRETQNSGRVTSMAIAPTCVPGNCKIWVGAAGGGVWFTPDARRHARVVAPRRRDHVERDRFPAVDLNNPNRPCGNR